MDELVGGIRRVTLPLPTRPGHVHAYLLPGEDGWIARRHRRRHSRREGHLARRARAGGRPRRGDLRHALPSRPRRRGRRPPRADRRARVPGRARLRAVRARLGEPGLVRAAPRLVPPARSPDDVTAELVGQSSLYRPFIRYQRDPILVEAGEHLDGWELVAAPGHADGQLCLLKDGVLIAADHLLGRITPTVGLWPASRADPLGDYLGALDRTIELAPRVALPGHGDPIEDPAGAGTGAPGAPPAPARGDGRGARRRAEDGLRPVLRSLRGRPEACGPPVRSRRDAFPPRAARARGSGSSARGRRHRYLYCGLIDGGRPPA